MSPTLPSGWFNQDDIAVYRYIYDKLIPAGSRVAEIGVYRGRSLCSVADIIKNKWLTVVAVDLFAPDAIDRDPDRLKDFISTAQEWGIFERLNILRGHSINTARLVGDNELSFVFIDADHSYDSVKADIEAWRPKLKQGAYFGGHDYFEVGVRQALDELCSPIAAWPNSSSIWLSKN